MKRRYLLVVGLLLTAGSVLVLRRTAPPAAFPMKRQMVQVGQTIPQARGGGGLPGVPQPALIEHRELRALLPTAIPGFQRTDASSMLTVAINRKVSRAEANFEGAHDARLRIEFTDYGGLEGLVTTTHAAWITAEINQESDHGFERTSMFKGYKALEESDECCRSGKIQIWVAQRMRVSVEGDDMTLEDIRAAVEFVDLDQLASLKPVAPEPK